MAEMEIYKPLAPERRTSDSIALLLLQDIMSKLVDIDTRLTNHMKNETSELAEEITKLMAVSFPASDPSGHRIYHEAQMAAITDRAAFWKTMRTEIGKYGIISIISFFGYAAWVSFLKGPAK